MTLDEQARKIGKKTLMKIRANSLIDSLQDLNQYLFHLCKQVHGETEEVKALGKRLDESKRLAAKVKRSLERQYNE